jgi:hypothetical protein
MVMKKPLFLVGLMLMMSLAGCIGNDDSGTVQVELTDEQLDSIMDDYFQDFVNNTTITINDETDSSTNYYTNGTLSPQVEYYVVDYRFTRNDVMGISPGIDHMNNTFTAEYREYNYSENNESVYSYELDCLGYYLVGLATTPVPYWQDSSNYMLAWQNEYNNTIAELYRDYAYQSFVRAACDETYTGNGSNSGSLEPVTLFEIEIPAGKAIMCERTPSITMWYDDEQYYSTAYGELRYAGYSWPDYAWQTSIFQMWDSMLGTSCNSLPIGSATVDTTFNFWTYERSLYDDAEYRFYVVYSLVDVHEHQP